MLPMAALNHGRAARHIMVRVLICIPLGAKEAEHGRLVYFTQWHGRRLMICVVLGTVRPPVFHGASCCMWKPPSTNMRLYRVSTKNSTTTKQKMLLFLIDVRGGFFFEGFMNIVAFVAVAFWFCCCWPRNIGNLKAWQAYAAPAYVYMSESVCHTYMIYKSAIRD